MHSLCLRPHFVSVLAKIKPIAVVKKIHLDEVVAKQLF